MPAYAGKPIINSKKFRNTLSRKSINPVPKMPKLMNYDVYLKNKYMYKILDKDSNEAINEWSIKNGF